MLEKFEEIYNVKIESNALKEYIEFKSENPESLILFQIGTFFETFFEDAKVFSEITGAILTSRNFKPNIEVVESGTPKLSVNSCIKKLLDNGVKVSICAEFKDEEGKNKRELIREYTPGTILENEFLDLTENNYIMAINFKNDSYDIAYADVSTGQIYKTKADLKQYKPEVDKISPNEILISCSNQDIFKNLISKYNATILDDKFFEGEIEEAIDKYCRHTQKEFKIKLDKIIKYKCSSFMMLDEITRKNLELTRTNYLSKKRGSILWFLNYTKTPMGIRLLKKFLSEPLLDEKNIIERLDAVEEFYNNPKLLDEVQNILSSFGDILRLCSKLSNVTISPKELLLISKNSYLLKDLKNIIDVLNSKLFKINTTKLDKAIKLAKEIDTFIKKDSPNEIKSGGIICDNCNSELDYLRRELDKLFKEVEKYEANQKKKLNLSYLKINSSAQIGYFIEVLTKDSTKIPNNYFKKHSTKIYSRYITDELNVLSENIDSLKFKINQLEYDIFKKIRLNASAFTDTIRTLAQDIALIDVIASLSRCALENNLTRPVFIKNDIKIKNGYHPSLIKLNNELIKNDTDLKQGSMMILTGANMSGKSTYIKHNALICILAQIGSFVSADSAHLPIIDKIFLRQNTNDDIINNNSSFMVELLDLKCIIENSLDSSLILLDEPAKSTNARESGAIARAFCEYILKKYKAKTIVATHNMELTKLEEKYPEVQNYVIGEKMHLDGKFDRKIRHGVIDKNYAIDTAILADLPKEILDIAKEYTK